MYFLCFKTISAISPSRRLLMPGQDDKNGIIACLFTLIIPLPGEWLCNKRVIAIALGDTGKFFHNIMKMYRDSGFVIIVPEAKRTQ